MDLNSVVEYLRKSIGREFKCLSMKWEVSDEFSVEVPATLSSSVLTVTTIDDCSYPIFIAKELRFDYCPVESLQKVIDLITSKFSEVKSVALTLEFVPAMDGNVFDCPEISNALKTSDWETVALPAGFSLEKMIYERGYGHSGKRLSACLSDIRREILRKK